MGSSTNYEDIMSSCIIEEEDIVEPLAASREIGITSKRSHGGYSLSVVNESRGVL